MHATSRHRRGIRRSQLIRAGIVLAFCIAIAVNALLKHLWIESRPHGWYVVVLHTAARGTERETYIFGIKAASRSACDKELAQAARQLTRTSEVCTEMTDEDAGRLGAVPWTLTNPD